MEPMTRRGPTVVPPNGGEAFDFGGLGGFENYFREVAEAWGDVERFAAISRAYSLEMELESVPALCRRFGLTFPEL